MDFWRTIVVLFRRWYVVLPAFLLAVGASYAVYASTPVVYTSGSVIVLTSPLTGGTQSADEDRPNGVTNPLLNFDHGLSTSASILIQALGTPEVAVELGATPGGSTTFQVTNGSNNPELLTSGPFVFIGAESRDPESAREMVVKVTERARHELTKRQLELNAPEPTYITVADVVPPTTPEAHGGSKSRAAAVAFGMGVIASLCVAYAAESFAESRRNRTRRGRAKSSPSAQRDPVGEPLPVR